MRDAFGRLLTPPERLRQTDRVQLLRELAGRLQAADDPAQQWLGRGLGTWLQAGGDLASVLRVRPRPGSRLTAQRMARAEAIDRLLLRLAALCGSQKAAARILAGKESNPAADGLVAELHRLRAPKSAAAFTRAKRRVSQARPANDD